MTTLLKIVPELRNALINGNFDFWQRQTSVSVTTTTTYLADRFCLVKNFGNASTYARSTLNDVPTVAQSGYRSQYSLLVTNNASGTAATGTNNYYIAYRMEGLDYQALHGKPVRIQFWVKNSVPGTYSVSLAGGVSNRSYVTSYIVNAANTWEKKSVDIVLDNTDTTNWIFDNTLAFTVIWSLSTGVTRQTAAVNTWSDTFFVGTTSDTNTFSNTANATFQLAQVALYPIKAGTGIDLPFVRAGRTIGQELQMCQRYYHKSYEVDTPPGTVTVLGAHGIASTSPFGSTSRWAIVKFITSMRTAPTVQTRGATGTINAAFGLNSSGTDIVNGAQVSGGGTSAEGFAVTNQSGSALTSDSAQMYQFHWIADAEL